MKEPLILVAEDERDIREFLAIVLQVQGFEVITARNGEEAVAQARRHRPDLILMDVRMPKMTGYRACEALKAAPDTRHIPIVFLSAYANKDEARKGRALGGEAYLSKPITPEALIHSVIQVLRQVQARKGELLPSAIA